MYDLLVEFENYIVESRSSAAANELFGVPGASFADIKTVYSHPQALSQCRLLPGRPQRVEAGAGGKYSRCS